MKEAKKYFDALNSEYMAVHEAKEDLFWRTYMGTSEDHDGFAKAETDYKVFVSNAERITAIKGFIEQVEKAEKDGEQTSLLAGLNGWLRFFQCNVIETREAQELMAELIQKESELFAKRKDCTLYYIDADGKKMEASTLVLRSNLVAEANEEVRESSLQGFLDLERWVVENGYIDLVKLRNKFARSLGYQNFFDYSVQKNESMTPKQLFDVLDDFEKRTKASCVQSLKDLTKSKGDRASKAHNLRFSMSGDIEQKIDEFLPFSKSLSRWVDSFKRLGITFMEADLSLDLLDRKGKFENGFMHGPIPCFYDNGMWQAAKINFTSNANPQKVGSGYDGLATLFHEGGHAAHCANVTLNAPCFSQEFAPTSMAYAETQSMFCDSLLKDADWLKKYAINAKGNIIPDELIKELIEAKQPFFSFDERSILLVPYFEYAVYSMDEKDLTADKLIALARETEQRILGVECSPRPLLAIPHLLSQESACSYQGYLLANMAVYQTRAWFIKQFDHLTDNSKIGPLLAKHYWNPGNSITHNQTLINLTVEGFSAKYLADRCNLSVSDAWKEAKALIEKSKNDQQEDVSSKTLNATIRIVHGDQVITDNLKSDDQMVAAFEDWVNQIA